MSLTYYRVLVDRATKEIKHVISQSAPMKDEILMEEAKDDELIESSTPVEFDEWNGVIDNDTGIVRARNIFDAFEDVSDDLATEPNWKPGERDLLGTVPPMEKYTKTRLPEDKDTYYAPSNLPVDLQAKVDADVTSRQKHDDRVKVAVDLKEGRITNEEANSRLEEIGT